MRVIPKRTKVRLELFKGIEVVDVIVGSAGIALTISVFLSNFPGHIVVSIILFALTVGMVVPLGDDKGYLFVLYGIRYLGRRREFTKRSVQEAEKGIADDGEGKKKGGGLLQKLFPALLRSLLSLLRSPLAL